MSNLNDEERQAISNFIIEFYKEAVEKMEEELGRTLTPEEFSELRIAVVQKFFGKEE